MAEVTFPPHEIPDKSRRVILFPAVSDGRQIDCAISYEALRDHFGADYYDPVPAFTMNRQRIEQYVTQLIMHSRFENDGTILVKTQDL